ncbi:Hypothetical protein (Fragment), partial [Durusdinium trenchii]
MRTLGADGTASNRCEQRNSMPYLTHSRRTICFVPSALHCFSSSRHRGLATRSFGRYVSVSPTLADKARDLRDGDEGIVRDFQELAVGKKAVVATRLVRQAEKQLGDSAWVSILSDLTHSLPEMSPQSLSSTCQAVAKLGFGRRANQEMRTAKTRLFEQLAALVQERAREMGPQEIARSVSGLAISKEVAASHPVFSALGEAATSRLDDFQAPAAAQLVNGLSKLRLGGGSSGVLAQFAGVLKDWLSELYPKELALVANAYARCSVPASVCDSLFEELATLVVKCMDDLVSQDVANLANAFAKLDAPGGQAGQELLLQLARHAKLPEMDPPHIAAMAWAYARLKHPEAPKLLWAIAEQLSSSKGFHCFSTQEIVNLLSAFAKTRVRHQLLLEHVVTYLKENPQVVAQMVPLDILYTASSLARMQIFDETVYNLLAQNIRRTWKISAKQGIYFLQSLMQAQCLDKDLANGLVPILQQALQRGQKDPSTSDWVVALGVLTSIPENSKEIDHLCEEIVGHCADHVMQGRPLSGLDMSYLLRALSRKRFDKTAELTPLLLWRLIENHGSFAISEFVSAVNFAVTMYVEDAVAFGVTDSIYSSVLNLLIQELTSGKRMIGLTHHELLTVASTLSKVADQEYSEPAWSAMMRETSRILMEDLEAAVSSDASLTHAIVVVLNCCARAHAREALLLGPIYEWLASNRINHLRGDLSRQGILAISLAKLGAAGQLEVRDLAMTQRQYFAAWSQLLEGASRTAPLEDRGPLVLGLAHTLHGLTLWSTPRQRALFREATIQQIRLAALETKDTKIDTPGILANMFQIYTGLQCFAFAGLDDVSRSDLQTMSNLLEILEPYLLRNTWSNSREGRAEMDVISALENIAATSFRNLAQLQSQVALCQFSADIMLSRRKQQ